MIQIFVLLLGCFKRALWMFVLYMGVVFVHGCLLLALCSGAMPTPFAEIAVPTSTTSSL